MKFLPLLLFMAITALAQNESPFSKDGVAGDKQDEMVYDFANIHKWNDVFVKFNEKPDLNHISWSSSDKSSHKGVEAKVQSFTFDIDAKVYEAALKHPDLNRGVRLISGDIRYPALVCLMRPLGIEKGRAYFYVSVPFDSLKKMHIAFIPREGKSRYLYNLSDVVKHFNAVSKPEK